MAVRVCVRLRKSAAPPTECIHRSIATDEKTTSESTVDSLSRSVSAQCKQDGLLIPRRS